MLNGMTIPDDAQGIAQFKAQRTLLQDVVKGVCLSTNTSYVQLVSMRRTKDIADLRHEAMYLARELTTASLPMIGRIFQRDHTSVLHAVRRIESIIERNEAVQERVAMMREAIEAVKNHRIMEHYDQLVASIDALNLPRAV